MSSRVADGSSTNMCRLRKQLAEAVRSLQWSYAIFWSSSPIQHGGLEWGEGYYNGDIKKTKKKSDSDQYGLQRSKQLRDLYLRMLQGDTRLTTTPDHVHEANDDKTSSNLMLSADDLSDEEWYYLVCMSYVFSPSHCLPGKALASGETIWLCNPQNTHTKIFSRSLLARSASIKTIVCFPYLDGVLELGVTQLIAEDLSLIQHVKYCLVETPNPQGNSKLNIVQGNWSMNQCVSIEYDDDEATSDQIKEKKMSLLKTMVPSVNEVDKEFILNNTIKYLHELEARVEKLESRIIQKKPKVKENILSELTEETSETEQVMVKDDTKFRGDSVTSVRMIKRELKRVTM